MISRPWKNASLFPGLAGKRRNVFLVLFVCLFLLLMVVYGFSLSRRHQENLLAFENEKEMVFLRLTETADNTLSAAVNACNTIFSQSWYQHYRSHTGIYQDRFTPLYRQEISTSLRGLLVSHPFLHDIVIITPYLNSAISPSGWYTLADYEVYYNTLHIENAESFTDYPSVVSINSSYCPIVLQDFSDRYYKGVIALLVDKKILSAQLSNAMLPPIASLTLSYGDTPLLSVGSPEEASGGVRAWASSKSLVRLEAGLSDYDDSALGQNILMGVLGAGAVSFLLALFFSRLSLLPFQSVLRHITGKRKPQSDPYEIIRQYITETEANAQMLKEQNQSLHSFLEEMQRALDAMRLSNNKDNSYSMLESFLIALQNKNAQECLNILSQAKEKGNCKPGLFHLLLSATGNTGFKKMETESTGDYWQQLSGRVLQWCGPVPVLEEEPTPDLSEAILQFIRDHFRSPEMSVNLLAAEFGVHRSLVSHIIKNMTGETFTDYVMSLRFQEAKSLLRTSNMTLTSVAAAVGYENYTSFKRAFMACENISPADYRKKYLPSPDPRPDEEP